MKKIHYVLALIISTPIFVSDTFAISLQDFRKVIFRPNNLPAAENTSASAGTKIIDIMNFLINLILFASGSVAVAMLVYGGIRLITSAGNQEGRDSAIGIIKWAIIGLFVVILSYALVTNIIDLIYRATT